MSNTQQTPPTDQPPAETTNPIARLLGSSKAIVVLLVLAGCFAAIFAGRATWEQVEEFMKYITMTWIASAGVEDASHRIASAMKKP